MSMNAASVVLPIGLVSSAAHAAATAASATRQANAANLAVVFKHRGSGDH